MKIAWGVMRRGGAIAVVLGLGQVGCHHHAPVASVQVGEAGLNVAGTFTSSSIVWPNGRVCTASSGHSPPRRGHGPPSAAMPPPPPLHDDGKVIDAFFFRLCEARANGDITQEQYHSILERFLPTLQQRDERSPAGVPRRVQPYSRPQRDPKMWHGEDAGGLSGPAPDPVLPPGAPLQPGLPPPAPTQPVPPPAPVQPVGPAPTAPPLPPSTGALPGTGR